MEMPPRTKRTSRQFEPALAIESPGVAKRESGMMDDSQELKCAPARRLGWGNSMLFHILKICRVRSPAATTDLHCFVLSGNG